MINIEELTKEVEANRINNDVYGNPRYLIHFGDINETYDKAHKIAKKALGAKKYRKNNRYFVFQSYNVLFDIRRLSKILIEAELPNKAI